MLAHINLHQLIFIDIETVPCYPSFKDAPDTIKELWSIKHSHLRIEDETPEDGYLKRAGVYAEFAKVICVAIGYFRTDPTTKEKSFRVKPFFGDNEEKLLKDFTSVIKKGFDNSERFSFCGHNIREFDIPFVSRRLMVCGIELPHLLDNSGKRPWQINDVDTLQLWKFGDYKNFISLRLLTEVLQIPSSKSDIDGKDVCSVYWVENDLPRIVEYCKRDVISTARVMQKFKGEKDIIQDSQIIHVN